MEILIPRNNLDLSPKSMGGDIKQEQITPIFAASKGDEEEKVGDPNEPQIKEYMLEQIRQAIKFKVEKQYPNQSKAFHEEFSGILISQYIEGYKSKVNDYIEKNHPIRNKNLGQFVQNQVYQDFDSFVIGEKKHKSEPKPNKNCFSDGPYFKNLSNSHLGGDHLFMNQQNLLPEEPKMNFNIEQALPMLQGPPFDQDNFLADVINQSLIVKQETKNQIDYNKMLIDLQMKIGQLASDRRKD